MCVFTIQYMCVCVCACGFVCVCVRVCVFHTYTQADWNRAQGPRGLAGQGTDTEASTHVHLLQRRQRRTSDGSPGPRQTLLGPRGECPAPTLPEGGAEVLQRPIVSKESARHAHSGPGRECPAPLFSEGGACVPQRPIIFEEPARHAQSSRPTCSQL